MQAGRWLNGNAKATDTGTDESAQAGSAASSAATEHAGLARSPAERRPGRAAATVHRGCGDGSQAALLEGC